MEVNLFGFEMWYLSAARAGSVGVRLELEVGEGVDHESDLWW